jgi:molybdopterin molybdotransferase
MPRRERTTCSFEDALDLVLNGIEPLSSIELPLSEAPGLVSAQEVVSTFDSPAFPQAAMDGFAVVAGDLTGASLEHPIRLRIAGTIAAGQSGMPSIDGGTCLRIMTGAHCPPPLDAVLPWELVAVEDEQIVVTLSVLPGQHIRAIGESLAAGTRLIAAGDQLSAAKLGLAASNGLAAINVIPRPRVALLTIGDELTDPGAELGETGIRDSNAVVIEALIDQFGADLIYRERLPDDRTAVETGLRAAAGKGVDLIVTVGGASSSDRDVLGQIDRPEFDLHCLDVRIRPGRPLIAGRIGAVSMIGLPGNPGAAFNSAWQFVRPLIRTFRQLLPIDLPLVPAVTVTDIKDEIGRRSFMRVRLVAEAGRLVAHPAGSQSSADQVSLAVADGLLVVREDQDRIAVGESVTVQVLDPDRVLPIVAAAMLPINRMNPSLR